MFTFTNLNNYGRLGNQLFQIAATISLANKHGVDYVFPEWKYAKYFEHQIPQSKEIKPEVNFQEPQHHYADYRLDIGRVVDIHGYFQSEKFFDRITVLRQFLFKEEIEKSLYKRFDQLLSASTCSIHIRRGDYVKNPNYINLPLDYYYRAMELIPNHVKFLVFSDDIKWCKANLKTDREIHFIEGNSEIEDLCLMSLCYHHIISNSTYAWWGAFLREKARPYKIIAPDEWYSGNLAKTHSDEDIVPERWIKISSLAGFTPKSPKGDLARTPFRGQGVIDLSDVTFTIPVKFDHEDRNENLALNINFLQKHFNTNITVMETGTKPKFQHFEKLVDYVFEPAEKFHRTKMLNQMALRATTPIIVNWDADVLIEPKQILRAVQAIRDKKAAGAYPYDGQFLRVPRKYFPEVMAYCSLDPVKGLKYPEHMYKEKSVGGAVVWDKESFIIGGMENENMISYGPEDYERFHRFRKLGFQLARVPGPLYHMDHYVGPDSSHAHPDFKNNNEEFKKVGQMSKEQLQEYVQTWNWSSPTKGAGGKKRAKQGDNSQPKSAQELNPLLSLNFDKIYLVNLDKRTDRLENAKKELALAGIEGWERISAVDGTALGLKHLEKRITPGMVGCFKTHYNLIKDAHEKGYATLCIFEDDVCFMPGFADYMKKAISQLPEDWQFVYLGCTEYDGFGKHKSKVNDYWVIPNAAWGTQGFMIRTKEAFKILTERLQKQTMQIDEQLTHYVLPNSGLKYYALWPTNMVSQLDVKVWGSDVQEQKQL